MLLNKLKGYIYLVLTFIIWGSLYVAAKSAMADFPPMLVLSARYGIASVLLFFVMKRRGFEKMTKPDKVWLFAIGAVGYFGGIAFQLMGTDLADASLASLINSLNPVLIPIIAFIFLKERLNTGICISIALSVFGVYIILGVGDSSISAAGIIVNLLSLTLWSVSCCMVRKISRAYDPIQITLYAMVTAFMFSLPFAATSVATTGCTVTLNGILSLLYIATVCTALSHVLWNSSLKTLNATTCSLFYPIQPLTSAVLAITVLGEEITKEFIIGAIIICLGILLAVLGTNKGE